MGKNPPEVSSFRGRGRPGGGRPVGFRKGSARAQHLKKVSLTRKEIRKSERRGKKAKKHDFFLVKVGAKSAPVPEDPEKIRQRDRQRKKRQEKRKTIKVKQARECDNSGSGSEDDEEERFPPPPTSSSISTSAASVAAAKLKDKVAELETEMKEVRKKRLLEENEEEDRYIKMLSKRLKLNKKAIVPASFREDGLDYLLEICDTGASRTKKADNGSIREDGSGENKHKMDNDSDDDEESFDENFDSEGDDDVDDDVPSGSDIEGDHSDDQPISDGGSDEGDGEEELSEMSEPEIDNITSAKSKKSKKSNKKGDGIWEDIYGRMRDSNGKVLDKTEISVPIEKSTAIEIAKPDNQNSKYVPPMRRENQTNREKIKKSLKGLLNRLTESNMHSISQQIEDMYMKNSRNEMNESLLELFSEALIKPTLMPERIILEYVMLIAILHANVGSEVGAYFIQNFIDKFIGMYENSNCNETDKKLENLALLSSFMYHFKIVDSCLIYDLLNFLVEKFTGKDVELILTIFKSVGFRLRKDDPVALKSLIVILQQKATLSKASDTSSRVKFMLEIILAIRNNNMNKIPNYDPSFGDHLLKTLKTHLHKGNYVSEMKISMQDLLNADTKGRWWIVGSAWTENLAGKTVDPADKKAEESEESLQIKESNEKLLEKARTLGMNTDTRRNIFCILMSAEDYLDAFEKLMRLGLKNQVERDIVHVIIYCCLQEKKFNPFYAFLASKLCQTERRFMLTVQFSLWDRLKDLRSNPPVFHLTNLSRFIIHLVNEKVLPLSVLKILDFSDMDKNKLKFLKKTLAGILLQNNTETLEEIFAKAASSESLNLFRESLKLFMNHFLLKAERDLALPDGKVDMSFKPETLEKLKVRVQIAERALSLGQSRVKL